MGLCLQLPQLGGMLGSAVRWRKWARGEGGFSSPWEVLCVSSSGSWVSAGAEPAGCCTSSISCQGFQGCAHPGPAPGGSGVALLDSGIWKSGAPQSRQNELDLLLLEHWHSSGLASLLESVTTELAYTFSQMAVLSCGVSLVLNPECLQRFLHEHQVLEVAGFSLQRHTVSCAQARGPAGLLPFTLTWICCSSEGNEGWGFSL